MPMRSFWLLGLVWVLGCGGDGGSDGPGGPGVMVDSDGGLRVRECMDEDGDGFGRYCRPGNDCDDEDETVTDECRRCVTPNKGCPCEPGTMPMYCNPEDVAATMDGVTGIIVCNEGARYCRDGVYSDCEILWQYATFVPDR